MVLDKLGLVVEGIYVADRTWAEDDQNLLGRPFEMGVPRSKRFVGIDIRTDGRFATETGGVVGSQKPLLAQELSEAKGTEGKTGVLHEQAAVKERTADS